ncbi:MAG: ASKHA domain-containing protein, partial [Gaiellales bacterium]
MSATVHQADHQGGTAEPRTRVALRFEPSGTSVRVPSAVTVFDAASWNGVGIDSTCGGHGTCKKCRVRVVDGVCPPTELDARAYDQEELAAGWRLACRAQTQSDLVIEVPPLETRPKAATVGVGRQIILRPALQKRYVELDEPTLEDQRSDLERLSAAMDDLELRVDAGVLRRLPGVLRETSYQVTAVVVDETLIDVEPGDTSDSLHAIAFDLGTTTAVATLLDVATGTPLAVASKLNHQQPFGADVISRISATMLDEEALGRLRELARQTLRELAGEVCADAGLDPAEVYEVALAGNVTMTQLALGIDPAPVGVAPFVSATRAYPELPASELGVALHPRARATVFPSLGAYVGGDIVSGLLATGMTRDRRLRLFIDVGTNCEIALGSASQIVCTAAPAGPAFEAAQIKCGMRAAPGAIESVSVREDGLELAV